MKYFTLFVALTFLAEELRHFYRATRLVTDNRVPDYFSIRARPLMFLFLFSWALPLSFVPIKSGELPVHLFSIRPELAAALPISAEMLCALVTAAFSGWLSDRIGWHFPTLCGIFLSILAALVSGTAGTFEIFLFGRALTGLGYGLAWMGIQALVVRNTPSEAMTFGIANMTAGIFTGHMLGSFAGGWLSEFVGYSGVFFIAALVLTIPATYAVCVFRPYFVVPKNSSLDRPASTRESSTALFRDRNFLALLFASVVPFSIAQVGFLYYSVPVFLHASGEPTSNIGTVLAIYSTIFVFSAPSFARFVDTHKGKKRFVVLGGLIGSAALLLLFAMPDISGVVASTIILAIASSIGGAAQTSYALQLDAVRATGPALATGIQRSADKFGQMLGPLIVGAFYIDLGLVTAVALTGILYLVCTCAYFLIARETADER